MKKHIKNNLTILLIGFTLLIAYNSKSQNCSNCSININSLDSSAYTVNQGQTFCLDSACTFIGSITIAGGIVCNRGLFAPKQTYFQSGSIHNYNNITLSNNLNIGSNCSLVIYDGSNFNISSGSLNLNGGLIENDGVISVIGQLNLTSGSFNNRNLINCSSSITGSLQINNSGIINKH